MGFWDHPHKKWGCPRQTGGMDLSKQQLLKLRLQAACRSSERLQVLTGCVGTAINSIHFELVEHHGWNDVEAAVAVNGALQELEAGLMETVFP